MAPFANVKEIVDQSLEHVQARIRVEAAFLFGSQAEGKADDDSDIDLAVFSPDVDGLNLVERVHPSSEISVNSDSRLELHLYPSRALAEARPSNFPGNIVTHGKRLI